MSPVEDFTSEHVDWLGEGEALTKQELTILPMIIIVSGLPGSGKSYFAEHLAASLDSIYINSDQVRHALQKSGQYSFEDKLVVYMHMLVQAKQALEHNRDVVIDATFYHHTMREMFLRLAYGYNTPFRVIEVIADENLIRERLSIPRKFSEADYSVYEKIREDFEEITMPHLTVQSTNDNLESMLNVAINYINGEGE
jgi:predicted kinase